MFTDVNITHVVAGISQNRTTEKAVEAISTSMRLFAQAVKSLPDDVDMYPPFSCDNQTDMVKWVTGTDLYR